MTIQLALLLVVFFVGVSVAYFVMMKVLKARAPTEREWTSSFLRSPIDSHTCQRCGKTSALRLRRYDVLILDERICPSCGPLEWRQAIGSDRLPVSASIKEGDYAYFPVRSWQETGYFTPKHNPNYREPGYVWVPGQTKKS